MSAGYWGPEQLLYPNQRVAAGETVLVVHRDTLTPASLVDDDGGSAPNPITADGLGNIAFRTEEGNYDLLVNDQRIPVVVPPGALTDADLASFVPDITTATGRALVGKFASREGTTPAESSHQTTPGMCIPVTEATTLASGPVAIGVIGDTLYGADGRILYSSLDNGRNWTELQTLPNVVGIGSGPVDLRPLGDGEVLVGRGPAGLWKSSGWQSNQATATWTQVVETTYVPDDGTHGDVRGDINPWGLSLLDNYVCVSEYQGEGNYRPASRRVWLSSDYGDTFEVVYDLEDTDSGIIPEETHLHATEIDPYGDGDDPRLWLSYHGYVGDQFIRYSDDLGATWHTFLSQTRDAMPTCIIATPDAVLFGSDGQPDGVIRTRRVNNEGEQSLSPIERVWTWRSNAPGLSLICRQVIRASNGLILFCFNARRDGMPAICVASDGLRAEEAYRYPSPGDGSVWPLMTYANIVNDEFVARVYVNGVSDELVHGTAPYWGAPEASAPTEPEPSPVSGGMSALPVPGGWISTPHATRTVAGSAINVAYFTPLWLPQIVTLDALAIDVVAAADVVGAIARLGIYTTHPTEGRADALILEAGSVPTDVIGQPIAAFPERDFNPGLYWLASCMQVASSATLRRIDGVPYSLSPNAPGGGTIYRARQQTGVSGALPSVALGGAALNRHATAAPIVWARVAT